MERDRNEQGRFEEKITDEDVLAVIRQESVPAQTAASIANALDVERPSVHNRLTRLHEEGQVERAKLTPRVVIWWIPDDVPEEAHDEH